LDLSGSLRYDDRVEGIPLADEVVFLHFVALVEVELGAIRNVVEIAGRSLCLGQPPAFLPSG